MSLVALSAAYGAGGSRIGPALARRLGVAFVDRAIPVAVADALAVPLDEVEAREESPPGSWLQRMLSGFATQDISVPAGLPAAERTAEDFRHATEEVMLAQASTGNGVILGRAAMIVLAQHPGVLRVRLHGPAQRRIAQAIAIEGIDRAGAERRLRHLDRTHADYVKQFYGADVEDCSLYDVVLDSTAIELDACVEMLFTAAKARASAGQAPHFR